MHSMEQIESLLIREGYTLEGIRDRMKYTQAECKNVYDRVSVSVWGLEREILHQSDVIELLAFALEKAQKERGQNIGPERIGHWTKNNYGKKLFDFECSVCGTLTWTNTEYCSKCGARMTGVEKVVDLH